jgi:hypothetical protein
VDGDRRGFETGLAGDRGDLFVEREVHAGSIMRL